MLDRTGFPYYYPYYPYYPPYYPPSPPTFPSPPYFGPGFDPYYYYYYGTFLYFLHVVALPICLTHSLPFVTLI